MARLLDKLASQPTPLFRRLNLDAQPERPFLQRLLTRLPQRRAGERYAFRPAPLAFLAWQPQRPLLSGLQFGDQPRIGPDTWLRKAPLESLAGSGQPLLGRMDSHRMPGVVLALLLLGLSFNYLLNLSDGAGTVVDETLTEISADSPEAEVIDSKLAAATDDAAPTAALTPAEEADISSELAESKTSNEEAMAAATAANLMAAPVVTEKSSAKSKATTAVLPPTTDAKPKAPADKPMPLVAAESTSKEAETSTVPKTDSTKPQASTTAEPVADAKPSPKTATPIAAKSVKAKAPPAPAPKTATEISLSAAAETVPDPEMKTTPSKVSATSTEGSAESQSAKAMAADGSNQTTMETAPEAANTEEAPVLRAMAEPAAPEVINPRRLSADRSRGILNSSRAIYLLGDGPLALERLGLALSAGHVDLDYIEPFRKLEADIRQLLALFDIANSATSPKMAAVSRAAFMDAEQAAFPHESSAYATRLEMSAASELNSN